MKRLNIWLCSMLLLCITACEKDLPVFEDPDCLLNFNYGSQLSTEEVTETMRNGSHSFKLKTPSVTLRYGVSRKPYSLVECRCSYGNSISSRRLSKFDGNFGENFQRKTVRWPCSK